MFPMLYRERVRQTSTQRAIPAPAGSVQDVQVHGTKNSPGEHGASGYLLHHTRMP